MVQTKAVSDLPLDEAAFDVRTADGLVPEGPALAGIGRKILRQAGPARPELGSRVLADVFLAPSQILNALPGRLRVDAETGTVLP